MYRMKTCSTHYGIIGEPSKTDDLDVTMFIGPSQPGEPLEIGCGH